eukprot:Gb_33966 [translate_table: standard]
MKFVGSIMTKKYSEGYPGARYYGGNEYIDMAESLCHKRALESFHLNPNKWGVEPLSYSLSNFQDYTVFFNPHDQTMELDLPHSGNLSHGYHKKYIYISFIEIIPYRLNKSSGYIDYKQLEKSATLIKPKLIIASAKSYAWHEDYAMIRKVYDK